MVADGAETTEENTEFVQNIRKYHIHLKYTEPYTPRQNFAERMIGEIKRRWRHQAAMQSVPNRLWDYGRVYEAEIMSRIAWGPEKRTGIERLTGDSINISKWLDFEFYNLVWFHTPGLKGPFLGQWLGVAHRVGGNLSYWIINSNVNVLARMPVQHVTEQEMNNIDIN
jgi:hypothetical protein